MAQSSKSPIRAEMASALTAGDATAAAALLHRFPVAADDTDDSAVAPLVVSAAIGGSVACLRLLHDAGFNLFVRWAAGSGKGATTTLHAAAAHGHLPALRFLLHGAGLPPEQHLLEQCDLREDTVVAAAARGGHMPCVRHLVDVCGADLSTAVVNRNHHYFSDLEVYSTPIHAAVEGCNEAVTGADSQRAVATVERMAFSYSFSFRWIVSDYGDPHIFPKLPTYSAAQHERLVQLGGVCAAPVEGLGLRDRVGFAYGKVIAAHLPPAMVRDAISTAVFRVTTAFNDPAMKSIRRGGTSAVPQAARDRAHTLRRTLAAELLILKRALAAAALLANLRARSVPPKALCDVLEALLRGHAIASRMSLDIPVVSSNVDPPLSAADRSLLLQVTKPFCTALHNITSISVATIYEDAARSTTAAAVNGPLQQHLGATFIGHALPHAVVPRVVGRRVIAPFLPLSAPLAALHAADKAATPALRRALCSAADTADAEAATVVRTFFKNSSNVTRLVGDTWRYSWQHDDGTYICWWNEGQAKQPTAADDDGGYRTGVPRTHGKYAKGHKRSNDVPLEYV